MKRLTPKEIVHVDYEDDVQRLVRIASQFDYYVTNDDAYYIWQAYSRKRGVDWMYLPSNDHSVLLILKEHSTQTEA